MDRRVAVGDCAGKKLISQEPVNIQGKDLPNGQTEDLKREAREDQKTRAETISETVDSVK